MFLCLTYEFLQDYLPKVGTEVQQSTIFMKND